MTERERKKIQLMFKREESWEWDAIRGAELPHFRHMRLCEAEKNVLFRLRTTALVAVGMKDKLIRVEGIVVVKVFTVLLNN